MRSLYGLLLVLVALGLAFLTACGSPPAIACTPAPPYGPGNWPPGCWTPYAASSPFNTPIPPNPRLVPNSSAIVSRVLTSIAAGTGAERDRPNHLAATTGGTAGEPTYYSQASDPLFTLDCTRFGGNCSIDGMQIRIPAGADVEGGASAPLTADRHMTIVDQDNGWEYDLWQVTSTTPLPATGGRLEFSWGGRTRLTGTGRVCEQDDDGPCPGIGQGTAAHFGNLAGRVRAEELEAGAINHALFIVINCGSWHADPQDASKQIADFVYPAKAGDQMCTDPNDAPAMGARFQLNMTAAEIDALPVRPWKKIFLHAMAKYGMFFGDTGANGIFAIETEAGNQYSSLGNYPDKWWEYGKANWEVFTPSGGSTEYVGKLYNRPDDPDPNLDWTTNIWSRLRVIDPCVSERTC